MLEAQESPRSGPVEIGGLKRGFEFAGFAATRNSAMRPRPFNPTVQFSLSRRHASSLAEPLYIDRMNAPETGPVATEMLNRLNSALRPTRIELVDDSEQHRGHGGYNPAGESHFSLFVESAAFAGKNRVQRQRMIYHALGDLMHARVHALSIRTAALGE